MKNDREEDVFDSYSADDPNVGEVHRGCPDNDTSGGAVSDNRISRYEKPIAPSSTRSVGRKEKDGVISADGRQKGGDHSAESRVRRAATELDGVTASAPW